MARFYQSSRDEVLKALKTSEQGLTLDEVGKRQEQYG